jgi:hypothetical protein
MFDAKAACQQPVYHQWASNLASFMAVVNRPDALGWPWSAECRQGGEPLGPGPDCKRRAGARRQAYAAVYHCCMYALTPHEARKFWSRGGADRPWRYMAFDSANIWLRSSGGSRSEGMG